MATLATLLRVPCTHVSLGFGPRLARVSMRGMPLELRMVPLGGYLAVRQPIATLPWHQAIALSLGGIIVLVAFTALLLPGSAAPATELLDTYEQLFRGVFSPVSYGQPLLTEYAERVAEGGLACATGIAFAKVAALSLIPLPTLPCGQLLLACVHAVRPISLSALDRISSLALLISVPTVVSWIIIVVRWFIQTD